MFYFLNSSKSFAPNKRKQKNKEQNEPIAKIRKINSKRNKENQICYICQLPDEILQKIVGYIPYWHRPRLRRTCKLMLNTCDSVLFHEFQTSISYYGLKNPEGSEYAALMAIKVATWTYVSYGFRSIFCGTILPLIWNNKTFNPEPEKIKTFLKYFYSLSNRKCGEPNSQFSRLLYCITLMRLLKKFKNTRLISSTSILPNYWRFVLELRGPWIGVLSSSRSAFEPHEPQKLLMILCEMLIANSTNRGFKKVWECDSEIFVFGNNADEQCEISKYPSTVFTFKLKAPNNINALLKSCLEDDEMPLPMHLPKGEFLLLIDVFCKEATKWGCFQVHTIEIETQFDENFESDYEE